MMKFDQNSTFLNAEFEERDTNFLEERFTHFHSRIPRKRPGDEARQH